MNTPTTRSKTRASKTASPAPASSQLKTSNASLKESSALMDEISALFANADDAQTIETLALIFAQLDSSAQNERNKLAQALRECEAQLDALRATAAQSHTEEQHASGLRALEREKSQIIQHILEIEEECGASRSSLAALKSELGGKAAVEHEKRVTSESQLEQMENKLSLYTNLTGIRFDSSCPDSVLAGYLTDPRHRKVRAFEYKQDSAELANQMWDMIYETVV